LKLKKPMCQGMRGKTKSFSDMAKIRSTFQSARNRAKSLEYIKNKNTIN
jgi:hypothetical protein